MSLVVGRPELVIVPADFTDPQLEAFLQAHMDDMVATSPPESVHALDLAGLQKPGVRLWVGTMAGAVVVSGALAPVGPGHEEVKTMRTSAGHRGRGLGRSMLAHLVADAEARGIRRLSLETGTGPFFEPAQALYRAAGFHSCPPFGGYRLDPFSAYFTLTL